MSLLPATYNTPCLVFDRQQRLDIAITHCSQKASSSSPRPASSHFLQPPEAETFYGFVKDTADARILVEAVIRGMLKQVSDLQSAIQLSSIPFRSGTVCVFSEGTGAQKLRWRDGSCWSSSKICGSFLLYREAEPITADSLLAQPANDNGLFATTNVRPGTRLVCNGFAKRTITIAGSDSKRYRVISYFLPSEIQHLYKQTMRFQGHLKRPSQCLVLAKYFGIVKERSQPVHLLPNMHGAIVPTPENNPWTSYDGVPINNFKLESVRDLSRLGSELLQQPTSLPPLRGHQFSRLGL
ncbi:Gti1/Pac2 family-domain-containing protein [Chytriomyces sp. MP71]|nr:Gti1/Pac2 family-domain-containing protein [Chytriomyces sp. MP71]